MNGIESVEHNDSRTMKTVKGIDVLTTIEELVEPVQTASVVIDT